jgi:hypothetical protein
MHTLWHSRYRYNNCRCISSEAGKKTEEYNARKPVVSARTSSEHASFDGVATVTSCRMKSIETEINPTAPEAVLNTICNPLHLPGNILQTKPKF